MSQQYISETFTREEVVAAIYGDTNEKSSLVLHKSLDSTFDGKYHAAEYILKCTKDGKFYSFVDYYTGSPFTDWTHDYENDSPNTQYALTQVHLVEVTVVNWEPVCLGDTNE